MNLEQGTMSIYSGVRLTATVFARYTDKTIAYREEGVGEILWHGESQQQQQQQTSSNAAGAPQADEPPSVLLKDSIHG